MPQPFERPYVDSSVYIAAILGEEAEPGKSSISAQVLELARTGAFPVLASTFVFAEVIKDRRQPELDSEQEELIDSYLRQECITWVEVDLPLAEKARSIARQHGLKPGDAIHLASAIRSGCDQLLSWNDGDFTPGLEVEGVSLHRPHLTGHPTPLPGMLGA